LSRGSTNGAEKAMVKHAAKRGKTFASRDGNFTVMAPPPARVV